MEKRSLWAKPLYWPPHASSTDLARICGGGYSNPMRIISDYQFVTDIDRGATAAIGNFDGVHLGHRSVIELARNAAPDAPLAL